MRWLTEKVKVPRGLILVTLLPLMMFTGFNLIIADGDSSYIFMAFCVIGLVYWTSSFFNFVFYRAPTIIIPPKAVKIDRSKPYLTVVK